MDNGGLLAVGLHVHTLVVVAHVLDNDSVIILHPPMVVQTAQEMQHIGIIVIHKIVLLPVRK